MPADGRWRRRLCGRRAACPKRVAVDAVGADLGHQLAPWRPNAACPGRACPCPRAWWGRTPARRAGGSPPPSCAAREPAGQVARAGPTGCGCRCRCSDRPARAARCRCRRSARRDRRDSDPPCSLPCDGIVEIALLHHHLRLHEVALRPEQLRAGVLGVVVAHACQPFVAPRSQLLDPDLECRGGILLRLSRLGRPTLNWSGELTPLRSDLGVLAATESAKCRKEKQAEAECFHGVSTFCELLLKRFRHAVTAYMNRDGGAIASGG